MDRRVWSILALLLLAGCSAPAPAPEPPAQAAPAPAIQAAPEPPAQVAPAPVVQEIPPLYEPPAPKDARLLTPDPTGRYIADVDKQLRVVDYTGNAVAAPEIPGDAVQYLVWAPRGDRLVVATGKPTLEPGVVKEARYWVVTLESGSAVELTGLPQDVVFSWALDQQSLYVLDNWRRTPPKGEYGERIQRYDLATGALTQLLDRQSRLMSVRELRNGDLLVGQYAGGGHGFYYRLPAGSSQLVKAAPFHITLSPDEQWAAGANLFNNPYLTLANVATGETTEYRPTSPWPRPDGDPSRPLWASDPVFDEESRWLLYTIGPNHQNPPQLRFFDRTKAEPDRVVEQATGAWIPGGPGVEALVLRRADEAVTPWRYDVTKGELIAQVGPTAPAKGGDMGCEPVQDLKVAANGASAGFVACSAGQTTFWFLDLGTGTARSYSFGAPARLLSLSADGQAAALILHEPDGLKLTFINRQEK